MSRYDFTATLADRRTPWGTGVESTTFATSAEMLEAAGLANLNVQKRPLFVRNDGDDLMIPGQYANVDAQGRIRGVGLSERYVTIQMEDAFGFADAIVDSGEAAWERAGEAKGGQLVFGCMELTHLGVNVPGDDGDLVPYLLVINSFGGNSPLQGIIAFIRPRCINTFEAARGTKTPYRFAIRHTGTLDGKLQMAREALGITFQHVAEVRELTTRLAGMSLAERQVRNIVAQAFADPDKGKWTESQDPSPIAVKVLEHYDSTPTIDGIRGTGWGLFNAVSEYLDHVQEYRVRDEGRDPFQLRAENLLVGKAQGKKEAVLAGLLRTK